MDFASYFYTKRTRAIAHAIETQVLTRPGYDLATLGPAKAREIIKMGSFDTIANVIKTMREIANVSSSSTHSVETEQALEELELDTELRNEFGALLDKMHGNIKEKSLNKIASLNKTIEELNEEVDRVTSEAEEVKKKLLEEIEALKVKNDELIAKEAEAKAQLAAAEKANNTLAKEVQTISDIAVKTKKEKENLLKEKEGLKVELDNAEKLNKQLDKDLSEAKKAKEKAEAEAKAEAEKANDKITALIERASKAETNYEQTKVRLDEAKKAKEEAEAEAKAEIKELKSQLAIVQEQLKTAIEVNKKVDDGSDMAEQKTKQQRKK